MAPASPWEMSLGNSDPEGWTVSVFQASHQRRFTWFIISILGNQSDGGAKHRKCYLETNAILPYGFISSAAALEDLSSITYGTPLQSNDVPSTIFRCSKQSCQVHDSVSKVIQRETDVRYLP